MEYNVLSSQDDIEAWHRDRAKGVTASEIALLESGGADVWAKLRAEKAGIAQRFQGNQYTAHGHAREPVIMGFLAREYGIEPNNHVLQSIGNPDHLGTPDGVHPSEPIIGEAKTSKAEYWTAVPKRYLAQAQWNLHVTGAERMILAVEYYTQRFDGELVTRDFTDPEVWVIERDDEHIARLVEIANMFLDTSSWSPLDDMVTQYLEYDAEISALEEQRNEVKKSIMETMQSEGRTKHVVEGVGAVSYIVPTEGRATFQKEKFAESYPELLEQFTVPGTVPKPSVRITAKKEKG